MSEASISNTGESVTVVVADDQSAVREGLVMLLGTVPGITVVGEAEDGEAAVDAVAAKDPQVVLMDLNMPRCDGVEATRRVRASHQWKSLPRIRCGCHRNGPRVAMLTMATCANSTAI